MNKRIVTILIVLIIVLSFVLSIPTAFASESTNYNYARKDDLMPSELGAADIISQATGEVVSDIERDFLSDNELKLSYSTAVNMSNVTAEISDGTLLMTVKPFEYIAQNGMTVSWIPYSVGDDLLESTNGEYLYKLLNIDDADYDCLEVVYRANVSVRGDEINEYINSAYDYADGVHTKLESERNRYNTELQDYNSAYSLYENYLTDLAKYESDKADYDAYVKAYSEWILAKDAYNAYLSAMDTYKSDMAKYQAYLTAKDKYNSEQQVYLEYLSKYEAYQKELDEYNQATASQEKQTAIYHLKILEFITEPMTDLNRTLSGAILGDSVTRVLAEKESLVTVGGVEGRAVDLAATATEKLRVLIKRLMQCNSDADKYTFYILYKDELETNFIDLLVALDFIYQYPDYNIVRRIMESKNGVEKYEILLAQLYCISNALTENDLPNYVTKYKGANKKYAGFFDADYTIGVDTHRTPKQILGDDYLEDKPISTPLENGYPGLPEEPVAPDVVTKPIAPAVVNKPVEPTKVDAPEVEPTKVSAPIKPDEVTEPVAPIEYKPTDEEIKYENALISGELHQRELLKGAQTIVIECALTKYFRNARVVTVRFYDGKNETPVCVVDNVEIGGSVTYSGKLPTKASDGYDYTFCGWQDEDGNIIDCNKLITDKSDLDLYPRFDKTPRSFPIVWVVDGVRYEKYYPYDSVPDYSVLGKITKTEVGVREYRFIGWQSDGVTYKDGDELPKVGMTEKEYVALFESSWIVTYKVDGIGTSISVWDGEIPSLPDTISKKNTRYTYYTFIGWDKEIEQIHSDTTYNALFISENYALNNGNAMSATFESDVLRLDGVNVNDRYTLTNALRIAKENDLSVIIDCGESFIAISKDNVIALLNDGVASIKFEIIRNYTNGSYRFDLKYFDSDGLEVSSDACVTFTLSGIDYKDSNVHDSDIFTILSDGKVSFSASTNDETEGEYAIRYYYAITIGDITGATVTVDKSQTEIGDTVNVSISELAEGAFISDIYYIDSDGEKVTISNKSFVMPDSDVRIGVIIDYYKYNITFKANGKVLSTQTYRYGDKVNAPTVPDISADEGYIYRFIGWDEEVGDAYRDMVYNAVFEKIEDDIVVDNIPDEGSLDSLVKILVILFYVAIGVVVVLAVLIPVLVVRKKRKKSAQLSNVDQDGENVDNDDTNNLNEDNIVTDNGDIIPDDENNISNDSNIINDDNHVDNDSTDSE